MKTTVQIACRFILPAFLLVSCKEKVPEVVDPLGVIVLAPLNEDIPYQALGSGKIVFDRLHPYKYENNGFYVLDIDKKTTSSWDIYLMNTDGSGCYQVSQSTGFFEFPSWTTDGSKILFTAPLEEYGCHIFVVNSDGTGLTQVTSDVKACDLDVSWSK